MLLSEVLDVIESVGSFAKRGYKLGKEVWVTTRDTDKLLRDLDYSLTSSYLTLRKDLKEVLASSSLDQQRIQQILDAPHVSDLGDDAVKMAFRDALCFGWDNYALTVQACLEDKARLEQKLAKFDTPPTGQTSGGGQRFRFFLRHRALNRRADALSVRTKDLACDRQKCDAPGAVTIDSFTEHAERLHAAIRAGFARPCSHFHSVMFSLNTDTSGEISQRDQASGSLVLPVGFMVLVGVGSQFNLAQVTVADGLSQSEPASSDRRNRVGDDLCYLLDKEHKAIDFNLLEDGSLWCKELHPDDSSVRGYTRRKALSTVLQSTFPPWPASWRIQLSATLAASMMQLATTPWYPSSFSSNNVFFKLNDADSITTSHPIHCSVFVSSRISSDTQTSEPPDVRASLVDLAILLLEIWHQKTMSQHVQQLGKTAALGPLSHPAIVEGWLRQSAGLMPTFFSDIISWCLEATFPSGLPVLSWGDITFRASFYTYVVKPLREEAPSGWIVRV